MDDKVAPYHISKAGQYMTCIICKQKPKLSEGVT